MVRFNKLILLFVISNCIASLAFGEDAMKLLADKTVKNKLRIISVMLKTI